MKQISLLVFFITLLGCKQAYKYENKIEADVAYLADDQLEGRSTGTEGEAKAAAYISERFKALGLAPKGTEGYLQAFTFKPKTDPHQEVKFVTVDSTGTVTGHNVVAFLDNKAPTTVVIGAHYDHLGYGDQGSLHAEGKAIHNGADDNASGVAVMLDLAGKLKTANSQSNYLFIAFSGEEMGLLGSNFFAKNSTLPQEQISYMVNMDMVGRLKADSTLMVYGVGTSPKFKQALHAHNTQFKLVENESGIGPSDHTSFYLQDIPVLHFFTGQHEDYHKPSDDTETLNYEGMNSISAYIYKVVTELDDDGKLAFRKTKDESEAAPRFKVSLGVMPDYAYQDEGMRIDGVREDKAAFKAGLIKGDVVVKLGDSAVVDMMSYMKALSVFKEGDTTTVVVKRDQKEVSAKIQF